MPLSFHLGYHSRAVPPGFMPGFGHAGLAGSVGWADPASGLSFGFVHNRLLTRMVLDQATFAGLQALIRRDAAQGPQAGLRDAACARRALPDAAARRPLSQPSGSRLLNHLVLLRQDSADVMANPGTAHAGEHPYQDRAGVVVWSGGMKAVARRTRHAVTPAADATR